MDGIPATTGHLSCQYSYLVLSVSINNDLLFFLDISQVVFPPSFLNTVFVVKAGLDN